VTKVCDWVSTAMALICDGRVKNEGKELQGIGRSEGLVSMSELQLKSASQSVFDSVVVSNVQ